MFIKINFFSFPRTVFFRGSYFIKAIENLIIKHSRGWENSQQCQILPTPLMFISGYANTENIFYCLNIYRSWLVLVGTAGSTPNHKGPSLISSYKIIIRKSMKVKCDYHCIQQISDFRYLFLLIYFTNL